MYLGLLLSGLIIVESCQKNEPIEADGLWERKIIYSTDTIVILDPEIGNEIKQVIVKTDTLWIIQNEK